MELSMSLDYLIKRRGTDRPREFREACRLFYDAGFRFSDYSPDFISDDWEKKAYFDREILDEFGISVEQTHAPFNRYCKYDPDRFPEYCMRLFEASKIIGAKFVVVHADEYRTKDRYDASEIEDFTYDYLAPFVDYAAKNGLFVALENVFEDNSKRWPQIDGKSRFTSRVEELVGIIERFNTPTVACCWDFGHAKCAFGKEGMLDALKQVGKYLVCTHVHDNYYEKDLHLVPFEGDTDWESHMKYLGETGYRGKLSFELVYGSFPDELLPVRLKEIYSVGEYLVSLFYGKR